MIYLFQVFLWVAELLDRRQIYKASHILSNIGVDPFTKLCECFAETLDKDLRKYLAEYLIKSNSFPDYLNVSWLLLKMIQDDTEISYRFVEKYGQLTVAKIIKMPSDLKNRVGIQLFFTNFGKQIALIDIFSIKLLLC